MTLFTVSRSGSDVDEIYATMRKFWGIDSDGICTQKTVVDTHKQVALKKAENSFRFIDGRYEIGIPWKEEVHQIVTNHKMAMKRLENTEKCSLKKPDMMKAYYVSH